MNSKAKNAKIYMLNRRQKQEKKEKKGGEKEYKMAIKCEDNKVKGFQSQRTKRGWRWTQPSKKACMKNNTHPYCSACRPSLRSRRAEQRCCRCCCRHGEGQDWLCSTVRPEADRTRRQLDKKRIHDKRTVPCCFLARWWDNLGGVGRSGGGVGLRQGHRRRRGGSKMVNVQCLKGPLLWVMVSEMFRKAERITLKDLSERIDTSSDVIPFVSIFGRIFNLMVPEEEQNFTVRSLTGAKSFCVYRRGLVTHTGEKELLVKNEDKLPDLNCFSFRR